MHGAMSEVRRIPAGKAKDDALAALQSDWYAQFKEAYTEWFRTQLASGNVPDGILRILNRDLKSAGIAKKLDDRVVHIHALRHSFGTHLSKAGVAPRVAQAAMRHSNISLTMGTYTDARLLDTAQAVESLPSLPIQELRPNSEADSLAPTLAPNGVQEGQNQSIPDNLETQDQELQKRQNPKENKRLPGVLIVGDIGFEPTTSTMSTLRSNQLS